MFHTAAPQRDVVKNQRVDPYDPRLHPVFVPPKQHCAWSRERDDAKKAARWEEHRHALAKRYHKLGQEMADIERVLGPRAPPQVVPPAPLHDHPPTSLSGGALKEVSCPKRMMVSAAELVDSLSENDPGILVAKDELGNLILVVGPKVGGQITLSYRDNVALLSREVSGIKQTSEVTLGLHTYEACGAP